MEQDPTQRSAKPVRDLRGELERARDGGDSFAAAWGPAIERALKDVADPRERTLWRRVLTETAGAWHAAYDGAPACNAGKALELIGADRDVPIPDLACKGCGAELEQGNGRAPQWCSRRCQRLAAAVSDAGVAA